MTACHTPIRLVEPFARAVDVAFDAPRMSSDGGVLLLRQVDERLGLGAGLASCLTDRRDARKVAHPLAELVRQRVYQLALGYEDCNDAASLRHDPALQLGCAGDVGQPLSSQPTLSRFENGVDGASLRKMLQWLEKSWVESLPPGTREVVLDIDSTDDPTHGAQQLTLFNGFYDQHMYHPLLVFDGLSGQVVSALLRGGRTHAAAGSKGLLDRLIRRVKARLPKARVVVRGDGAYAMPRLMAHLDKLAQELGGVEYVIGLPVNAVLKRKLTTTMAAAAAEFAQTQHKARHFAEFRYAAGTWPHERRVVGKAEHGADGANPRWVVTNIEDTDAEEVYRWYCQRGDAENCIKDLKNALRADRLSCCRYRANFVRLLLTVAAYRLMHALRKAVKPREESLGRAQFDTLRLRLLKVAAWVTRSVRRVLVRLPQCFPLAAVFAELLTDLQADSA